MHLFFMTRGVKHNRDVFVTHMQSQFFPWTRKNLKTKKNEVANVQGALRPIELWEYVFPEEHLDEVLTMINAGQPHWGNGKAKYLVGALRKVLGAVKLPKWEKVPTNKYIFREGVGIEIIGIKKDERADAPWGYNQEML